MVELLRAGVRGSDQEALRQTLGSGAGEVARLLPELQAVLPDLPPPAAAEGTDAQFRLFDAVVSLLRRTADRPLLVLLEDLRWADAASLRLLE